MSDTFKQATDIQQHAADLGFDWPNAKEVIAKLREEIAELEEVLENPTPERMQDEFGDILYTCVNLARHLNLDIDKSLASSTDKFSKRFKIAKKLFLEESKEMRKCTLEELLEVWERAKQAI